MTSNSIEKKFKHVSSDDLPIIVEEAEAHDRFIGWKYLGRDSEFDYFIAMMSIHFMEVLADEAPRPYFIKTKIGNVRLSYVQEIQHDEIKGRMIDLSIDTDGAVREVED